MDIENAGKEAKEIEESRVPTGEDLKRLCARFNELGVKYLLVGGFAINYWGYPRATMDIDFLVETSSGNIEKIKEALLCLGDGASKEINAGDINEYAVVRVADEIVVDLIGKIGDLAFDNAGSELFDFEGVSIPVADLDTMIRSKQGIRAKDREDLTFLQMVQKQYEENTNNAPRG